MMDAIVPNSTNEIRRNLQRVRERIRAACERVGRDESEIRLLVVTKTVDAERIRIAHAEGCRSFGENKVQEAITKRDLLSDLSDVNWSVIGHLQTNKAKFVARFATEFHALDSLRVAAALDRRLQMEGRGMDVLVQVNTSGETSKFGLLPEKVHSFLCELRSFSALHVRGMMTLAVFSEDFGRIRECFLRLREVRDQNRERSGLGLDELSMGMSKDFEIAIEEGATVVRIGQAIFGERSFPDSHYWPHINNDSRDCASTGS